MRRATITLTQEEIRKIARGDQVVRVDGNLEVFISCSEPMTATSTTTRKTAVPKPEVPSD